MFGKSGSAKKLVAIADIGSGSAAVAIAAIHKDGPATIVASSRVAMPFEERTPDAMVKGVIASLSDAAGKALALYGASPYKGSRIGTVYAVVRAPWTRSKTERSSSRLEKDTRITNPMIGKLAQDAVAADKDLDRTRLIESSVVRVELNGYPTGAPVGKSAHLLSVIALMSDCEPGMRSGVQETLEKAFPQTKAILRSGARALISGVGSLPGIGKDYVILNVEGETTNILVVRGGLANENIVIPEGVRSIVKRISEKGLPEETLSLLRMVEREECSGDACDAINASVARVELDLARVYGEGLTKIASVIRLPTDLILVTHPAL